MFAFFNLGTMELVVLLVLGLLLFGNRLPGMARSLGKALTEFKQEAAGLTDLSDEVAGPARRPGK